MGIREGCSIRRPDLEKTEIEVMSLEVYSQNNKVFLLVAYRTNEQLYFWDSLQL